LVKYRFFKFIHFSFRIKTILIPSLRDIHHDSIYPLSPFSINENKDSVCLKL